MKKDYSSSAYKSSKENDEALILSLILLLMPDRKNSELITALLYILS